MMTPEELDAIEARANAASPGPWFWNEDDDAMFASGGDEDDMDSYASDAYRSRARIIETDSNFYPPRENDRAFIAASRTDIPALIAEIRRLRSEAK